MSGQALADPRLGLALTTVGRRHLGGLLNTAARSARPPHVVAIADQSGGQLKRPQGDYPFELIIVDSTGGASIGRNDAVRAMGASVDVLGFPNDHTSYPSSSLADVVDCFVGFRAPEAVSCRLEDPAVRRLPLPPTGTELNRRSVWRAIEPTTFLTRVAFESVGGFRGDLGTGCPTPWQSGEITDLLLRMLNGGGRIVSQPEIRIDGESSDKRMLRRALLRKHRGYARGTGFVYRIHHYPASSKARIILGPWLRIGRLHDDYRMAVPIAVARSLGRAEGLLGRTVGAPLSPW